MPRMCTGGITIAAELYTEFGSAARIIVLRFDLRVRSGRVKSNQICRSRHMKSGSPQFDPLRRVFYLGFILLMYANPLPLALGQFSIFSYQGRLTTNQGVVSGLYDFQLRLWDGSSNGNPVGVTLVRAPVSVEQGLFQVQLDFGTTNFDGSPRFLEIGVRTNGSLQP